MKKWELIAFAALTAISCNLAAGLSDTAAKMRHGEVVASVGKHRLHRSDIEKLVPAGVSPEDSAGLAQRYINSWAAEILMLDMAEGQLTKSQKDVSAELEEYRRALLKYRYEQLYINQRLDTLVTEEELSAYYKANQDKFKLERPVIRSRYMIIPADSRSLNEIKKKMSAKDDESILQADSLAFTSALKYVDSSETWMDAITLAQELGVDYSVLLSSIKNSFAEITDDAGNLHLAYIVEMVPGGKPAPLEYCSDRIKDIILSARKHSLESSLEKNLLQDAIQSKKFVIY